MQVRDAGVWKTPTPHARDGGVWKPVQEVWARDAGAWKRVWNSEFLRLDTGEVWQSGSSPVTRWLGGALGGNLDEYPERYVIRSGSCPWMFGGLWFTFSVSSANDSSGHNIMFSFAGDIRSELTTAFRLDAGDGVLRAPSRIRFVADAKFGDYTSFEVNNTNRAAIYSLFGTKLGQPHFVRLVAPS